MGIKVNDYALLEKLKQNGNNCLCTVEKTCCFCDEFRQMDEGVCHCSVFVKCKEGEGDD